MKTHEFTGKQNFFLAYYFVGERGRNPNYFEMESQLPAQTAKQYDFSLFSGEIRDFVAWHLSGFQKKDQSYNQIHTRPVKQMSVKGHAAQALYLYSAMTNQAQLRNDSAMLNALISLWR
jgi:DUF1680 family protein